MLFSFLLLLSSSAFANNSDSILIEGTKAPQMEITFFTDYVATNQIRECQEFKEGRGPRSGPHPHWAPKMKTVEEVALKAGSNRFRVAIKSELENDICEYKMFGMPNYAVSVSGLSKTPAQEAFGVVGQDTTSSNGINKMKCSFPTREDFVCRSLGNFKGTEKTHYIYEFGFGKNSI